MALEIKPIGTVNLPDAARLCLAGKTLSDRPPAFTREVELDSTRCKLSFLRGAMTKGARALAAYRAGMLVGYAELHPVADAPAPVRGVGAYVVTCLRVPEEAERVEVEAALLDAGAAAVPTATGLVVIAREKNWGAHGFAEAAREESEVDGVERVLWWRPVAGGPPVEFVPVDRKIPRIPGKVRVDLFWSDRCPWDRYVFDLVRQACSHVRGDVVLYETDCTKRKEILRCGVAAGIAVNGKYQAWLRPHRLPDPHGIRRKLEGAT